MNRLPPFKCILGLSLFACIGCRPLVSRDEVARVTSPDGHMAAVLFETNGGATTSFGYEVQLDSEESRTGKSVAHLYGAVRNEQSYGVDLKWENDRTLVIECLRTKQPPEAKQSVNIDGRDVEVILRTGVEDTNAPAGGMLSISANDEIGAHKFKNQCAIGLANRLV